MYRVNVNGVVLMLSPDALFDLLEEIRSEMRGIITRCADGYVIDSLQRACVHVIARPLGVAA